MNAAFAAAQRRLLAEWRLKLLLTAVLNAVFWTLYSWLGRHAWFPLRVPPVTWLDTAIPYTPAVWSWVYLSQFLLSGLLPWFIDSREVLGRFVRGFVVLSGISFVLFGLFPVASPRPEAGELASGAMAIVRRLDGTLNAFPSLHAGCLVYLLLLGRRMFRGSARTAFTVGVSAWGAAILFATIATRQHYAADLAAGAVIGMIADWLAWRRPERCSAATTMSRKSGVAFQDGCR